MGRIPFSLGTRSFFIVSLKVDGVGDLEQASHIALFQIFCWIICLMCVSIYLLEQRCSIRHTYNSIKQKDTRRGKGVGIRIC
jgi:hypothetical protein